MKKKRKYLKQIQSPSEYSDTWKLYREIGEFAKELNNLPDAAAAIKSTPKGVPSVMVVIIF